MKQSIMNIRKYQKSAEIKAATGLRKTPDDWKYLLHRENRNGLYSEGIILVYIADAGNIAVSHEKNVCNYTVIRKVSGYKLRRNVWIQSNFTAHIVNST